MKTKINEQIRQGLTAAIGAVFELDDMGIAVVTVEVDGGMPVIGVDREPPGAKPGTAITRTLGGRRETLHTAVIHGCRVQWHTAEHVRGAA